MKFQCSITKLQNAVSKVEKVSGKNLSLAVLNYVLLEVKNKTLTIKATNLDVGVTTTLPVKSEGEGVVAVSGSIITSFLSQVVGEETVEVSLIKENLQLATTHTKTLIKTQPKEDFPNIPNIKDGVSFEIEAKKITDALRAVWYSAAVGSMKPELSSVFLSVVNGDIVCAATDSFRLAEKKIKINNKVEFENILIPAKNVPDIIRVLESGGNTTITINKNQIAITLGDTYLVSRLVDGAFPDYKQIIPTVFVSEATVLKEDIINALKVANIFSDAFHQIKISLSPKDKQFIIETKNNNVGESSIKIPAALSGEAMDLHFNYKYIADCFQSITTDSLTIQFSGQGKPVVITGVSNKDFLYLVMPMNK